MSQPVLPVSPSEAPASYTAFVPPAAMPMPLPNSAACANCLAPLTGAFCAQCGAPRLEDRPLTVRRFGGDLWTELTSVDSATIRTIRALVLEPGRLTREYLDGRTRWYLSPLRLFLLATSLMVFVSATSGYQQRMIDEMRSNAEVQQRANEARYATKPAAAAVPAKVAAPAKPLTPRKLRQRAILRRFKPAVLMTALLDTIATVSTSPWLQIGNPLAVGLALALVLRRKRRNYAEHFVHALHFMAFSGLLSAALIPVHQLSAGPTTLFSLASLLYWVIAARYFFLSARRIYGDSIRRTVADTALFAVTAQTSMMMLPIVAAIGTIVWLVASLAVRILLA